MIGCDVIRVSRFKKNIDKWPNKILGNLEKEEFYKTKNKLQYIAGRWALKESIYKINPIVFNKINILNKKNGKPYVKELANIYISLSHDGDYCFAVAYKGN